MINLKTGIVAYAVASYRVNALNGNKSTAEHLAKNLRQKMERDDKRLGKVISKPMERIIRFIIYLVTLLVIVILSAYVFVVGAQTIDPTLKPDFNRVRHAPQQVERRGRKGGYYPERAQRTKRPREPLLSLSSEGKRPPSTIPRVLPSAAITPGTPLSRVLHTSQFDINSAAGTHEQFVDRNGDLVADDRTTFDFDGGSFDIALGKSGARYEVYSATRNQTLVGVLVVALDTNGDYLVDSKALY